MPTYYVDPVNGNDADDGLSWANAFLTLNGAEDEPVAAGDLVWVGPGVYRELLTLDVDGGVGTEIVYVADVTGEHTDGVGGIIRVTGSDNDQTTVRNNAIIGVGRDHRIFRGFFANLTSSHSIQLTGSPTNIIFEDCVFFESAGHNMYLDGAALSDITVRRCMFAIRAGANAGIYTFGAPDDAALLLENCYFIGGGYGVQAGQAMGGITIRNCTMVAMGHGARLNAALGGAATDWIVENSIFTGCATGLRASVLGDIVEDFNTFFRNTADRNTVNIGANSETFPALFLPPLLHAGASQANGFKFPWRFGELSEWSQIAAITGANEPGDDLHAIPRPVTAGKNSWGAQQFVDMELESGTVQAGTYARVLHDAGQVLVRRIPVTGVEITVTLYMRFEADYEPDPASLPQMVIKQPGQADQVTVMTVAANNWEQLSDTFTPASPPGFVEVWAESLNTAAAGNYEVFYDTMGVA